LALGNRANGQTYGEPMNKFGIIIFIIGTLFSGAFAVSMSQVDDSEAILTEGTILEDSSYSESLNGFYTCRADLVVGYNAGTPTQVYTAETFATMESSNSCVELIEQYYPVGDKIDVYYYEDSPGEYSFYSTSTDENGIYACCAILFGLLAIGGLIMTFTLGGTSAAVKTGGLSGRSSAGGSSGIGQTGGLRGRNEQNSKNSGVMSLSDPNFSGPHQGKFLSGHTRHGNRKFSTFQEAKEFCLADREAGGITMEGENHFTVRRENNLLNSSMGEVSWVKKVEYNSGMAGTNAQSSPTSRSPNVRLPRGEYNYDSLIQRYGLQNVPAGEVRNKVMAAGLMTPAMADKFFENRFVIKTLGLEEVPRQANIASSVLQAPKKNFWKTAESTISSTSGVQEKCGHSGCSRSVTSFDFRCFDCRKRFCDEHRGATFQCSECA
jgi:hypothetical protein